MAATLLLPHLRAGLGSSRPTARAHCVGLVAHVVRLFRGTGRAELHADLAGLCDDAEEDKDFWRNMVHIQVHRRGRALGRLRKVLQGPPEEGGMGAGSVAGVLLPLAV